MRARRSIEDETCLSDNIIARDVTVINKRESRICVLFDTVWQRGHCWNILAAVPTRTVAGGVVGLEDHRRGSRMRERTRMSRIKRQQ